MRKIFLLLSLLLTVSLFSNNGKNLAKQLGLSASAKVATQWARVFKKNKKMIKYGIDKLSNTDKNILKAYLISHAADSDTPEAAGM
ncbi:MAG: hypothetical protein MJK08_07345 [Campylobacterales bacterium]|nr:hypothetical protein [Campylobacterales bacterium]NQY52851.1 hypothetical protein [Campylobacteraceae bacterium]